MFLTLLIVFSVMFIFISWLIVLRDRKQMNVPGPLPLPLLGNALLFLGDSAHFLNRIFQLIDSYGRGGALCIYLLKDLYILFTHPKYIEIFYQHKTAPWLSIQDTGNVTAEPLISSSELIVKGKSYRFVRPWLGQGLLTSSGQRWRSHRKFLTPAFHFNILQNFLPVFCQNGKVLTDKLSKLADGSPVNLFPIIALTALDNVTESIMGVSVNAQKDSESNYVKAIEELSIIISLRMRNPFVAEETLFNMLPYKRRQDKALAILQGQTMRVIETRREELRKNNITSLPTKADIGIKNKHAFLDLLLLSEIDGVRIDDESVREEVDTFMFEGHDTTTSAIVFCLYCLSKYEEAQSKVLKEQQDILGADFNRDPSYAELKQMKYLELVIKEALRLYPSVPLIERHIIRDTEIGGVNVPKNTSVVVGILQMQRHPDMFENPLEFIPERFDTVTKSPFSWIPFSAGPRNCIGQKFAMMEMKVTLSAIVKSFKIMPSGIEPELCADLILRSRNGVHVGFKPRF